MSKKFAFLLYIILTVLMLLTASDLSGQFIRGRVVDVSTREPLVGATIFVPKYKMGAYTNSQGIYSIKMPDDAAAEELQLMAIYFGYDTSFQTTTYDPKGTVTVGFSMSEKMVFTDEVQIIGKKTGEIQKTEVDAGVTTISPQEINLLPSVGAPDLAQYLQVLPGVVFTGDQGGQLYIRGGTPIQNMVMMDGMIMYSPFHSIGLFSVFDPDYIRSIDVYSAAFPADFGGRVSSVIDIKTRNGSFNSVRGKVNVNPFSSGILLEGPLGKSSPQGGGVSFLVSARNNYIDRTAKTFYPYVNDTTGLPYNFMDLYGKLTLTDGINYANVFGFRQTDNVNFEFPANLGWESYGGGANFQMLPAGAGAIITGSFAYSQYNTSLLSQSENFPRESGIRGFNGTLKVGYIFNSVDEFNFGMSFLGFGTDYLFTNSFGLITEQQASNSEAAAYMNYKKVLMTTSAGQPFERAVIEPSIRVHYYNNQARPQFEPRIRLKLNLPRVSFSAAAGMYSQNLMAATSDRDVVNLFQGFLSAPLSLPDRIKNTTLQTGWHALGGVEMELVPNLSTRAEAWVKDFTQLTNINRDKIFPSEPNFITETGFAHGYDFILKYQTRKLYLYTNYGWAKVWRTDRLQTDNPRVYPTVFDRRHTVNVVAAYRSGEFPIVQKDGYRSRPKFKDSPWEFSFRWTMGSGFPFTQTQGYFEKLDFRDNGAQTDLASQNGNLGLILSEELNGGRLPYYHRLDLSAKRRWILSDKVLLELSASVVNAYNRQNIFYFDRIRYEPVYQLPVIPSLGLTAKY